MAAVEITFFTKGPNVDDIHPVARLGTAITEVLTSSGTSAQSAQSATALGPYATIARVRSDGDVWVAAGADPTAVEPTAGNPQAGFKVAAGTYEDFLINPGDKLAVIDAA